MAKVLVKKGSFEIFCPVCRSRFKYEYTDTFLDDGARYIECIVCSSGISHSKGVGNTA